MEMSTTRTLGLAGGFAIGATVWVASAMFTTSAIIIPSLLHPTQSTKLPQRDTADRLTPQVEVPPSAPTPTTLPHKYIAQQFGHMDKLSFRTLVPLEMILAGSYTYLALTSRRSPSWWSVFATPWAPGAVWFVAVFPFTAILMGPYSHKLLRIAGLEEKVEPFEDALPDREAEDRNVVEFLTQWSTLNIVRCALVAASGGFAVWRAQLLC